MFSEDKILCSPILLKWVALPTCMSISVTNSRSPYQGKKEQKLDQFEKTQMCTVVILLKSVHPTSPWKQLNLTYGCIASIEHTPHLLVNL